MWTYYAHNQKPPERAALVQVVAAAEEPICTEVERQGLTSDAALAVHLPRARARAVADVSPGVLATPVLAGLVGVEAVHRVATTGAHDKAVESTSLVPLALVMRSSAGTAGEHILHLLPQVGIDKGA